MRIDGRPEPINPAHAPRAWGRRRLAVPAEVVAAQPAHAAPVTTATVAAHLLDAHGFPYAVVDAATVQEMLGWHTAEHRTRTETFLRHTHTAATGTTDDPVLEAKLTAIREGRTIPRLEEILDRANYARTRQAEGLVLSRYDRDCLAIARAVDDRAARRARRRSA